MTKHNLFYYPYASFTNAQFPLLKVAALYFDKLVILDPVGANWTIPGAEWLLDWRAGKKILQENGLHYLLSLCKQGTNQVLQGGYL